MYIEFSEWLKICLLLLYSSSAIGKLWQHGSPAKSNRATIARSSLDLPRTSPLYSISRNSVVFHNFAKIPHYDWKRGHIYRTFGMKEGFGIPKVLPALLKGANWKSYLENRYKRAKVSREKKKADRVALSKSSTTPRLKEIFISRCYLYKLQKGSMEEKDRNCEHLWNLFLSAFKSKSPCNPSVENYRAFLDEIDEVLPTDRLGLLWSGTREIAHTIASYTHKYVTLEDTMAGYLLNNLTWCGSNETTSTSGITFGYCPFNCRIQGKYWKEANKRFAQKLSGLVYILLNGTRQHTVDRNIYPSYMKHRYYLGPAVIPNLDSKKVKKINIVVAHSLDTPKLESCGQASVKRLQKDITKRGIPVQCFDDPPIIRRLNCINKPLSKSCSPII